MTTSTPEPARRKRLRISLSHERLDGTVLADRGGGDRGRGRRLALVECRSQSVGAPHLDRLCLSRSRSRDADRRRLARLQSQEHLSARLHRRPRQHAACRRHRHRARDRTRDGDRHRAVVVQLAAVAAGRGLCRSAPRSSAAAAALVLVRADAGPSGGPRRMDADRRRLSFKSRPDTAVDSDRGRKPLGDRHRRDRADRVVCAAPATGRTAAAGRPAAPALALRACSGGGIAGAGVMGVWAYPGPSPCPSCAASILSAD